MCGITGYVGAGDCLELVAESLETLEYRGYDSVGVACVNDSLTIAKQAGQIEDLHLPDVATPSLAIGHTRWSTHGEPTDANAHPHTDCTNTIAVVHNGIIENYDQLRKDLEDTHTFRSETDTEVVPHLLEDALEMTDSLYEALASILPKLEGSFALAVTREGTEEIVIARNNSPLVIGEASDGNFIASDVPAFIKHTRNVRYLEDGDIARITADAVEITNQGTRVDRPIETVDWDAEAAEKGGYDHYMLKEIHEQPQSLRQALAGRVDTRAGEVDLDLSIPAELINSLEEIQLVACGTSYHAALYAARTFGSYAGIRTTATVASEYDFPASSDPWRTLVIAITQSGETADTLTALREANAAGARTLAVTNTVGSSVTREADWTVNIQAGPEIGVAATKTFAGQVLTTTLVGIWLGRQRGELGSQAASELIESLEALPGAIQQVLDRSETVTELARTYADCANFFFIGRRHGMPVALESALKLKEISYDHAEGFPAGELKHGPLALVTDETMVVALLTDATAPRKTLNNVKEVQSRGATVLGLVTAGEDHARCEEILSVPAIGPMEPLVANVYTQLFAYGIADEKGRPIDKPRNLAKSVTVE